MSMREFSSISVSSYDATTLADRLTDASREGWDVVAIVPAGTNVVAYLARPADATASPAPAAAAATATSTATTPAAAADSGAPDSGDDVRFTLAGTTTPEAAAAETALADSGTGAGAAATQEPREPSGWATAPGSSGAAPAAAHEAASDSAATPGTGTTDTGTTGAGTTAATSDAGTAGAGATSAATTGTGQQAEVGAAPAGWYADPAGRYELRYWDGTQWTEHVSRAGQQYTDPPVA